MLRGLIPKYCEVIERAQTMYIFQTALNCAFKFFLKSTNLKQLLMSLKIHSTETRTLLIAVFHSRWACVVLAPLNGPCSW